MIAQGEATLRLKLVPVVGGSRSYMMFSLGLEKNRSSEAKKDLSVFVSVCVCLV